MTHHAYIIEAGRSASVQKSALEAIFGDTAIETSEFSFDTLGIDEARVISELSAQKGWEGKRAIFVFANFITREAQNSLLKTLEEPLGGSIFFLIVPAKAELLPTVLSRLATLRVVPEELEHALDPLKFLSATKPARLKMIAKFVEALADEERSRMESVRLIEALEREVHIRAKDDTSLLTLAAELETVRSYLHDRAPSQKMLLEHTALLLPVLK